MDLRKLNHLVTLADTGNFHKAAELCHITQSAFSRSIQAAEDEYGLQLFERGTLRVSCTPAGAFVVERARKLLFESRNLARDIGLYRNGEMGNLNIGVGPYPAMALVPGLVVELRRHYPGVRVRVEVNNADYLAEHTRAEELDFYLADVRNVVKAGDLATQRMGRIAAGFYVRPGHPLLSQPGLRPQALLSYELASVRAPRELLVLLGSWMGLPEGEALQLAVETDDVTLLRRLATDTDTIVACPDAGVAEDVRKGNLAPLQLPGMPDLYADISLVRLRGRSFSPLAQFAVDFLRKCDVLNASP